VREVKVDSVEVEEKREERSGEVVVKNEEGRKQAVDVWQ
jgi:hypothetical protein